MDRGVSMVDRIVERVMAELRPELETIRQLVARSAAPANDAQDGPLLTREELMATLRLSKSTMTRWNRDGCPRIDIGERLPRYRITDVLTWRARAKQEQAAPVRKASGGVRLLSRGRR